VKSFAGLGTVDEFDRSNLDHAMAVQWVEAACLGIEGEGQPGTEGSQKDKERASDLSHMGEITTETKKIPLRCMMRVSKPNCSFSARCLVRASAKLSGV
jgi:hypothetical protein